LQTPTKTAELRTSFLCQQLDRAIPAWLTQEA
jgi:hypothetical protein